MYYFGSEFPLEWSLFILFARDIKSTKKVVFISTHFQVNCLDILYILFFVRNCAILAFISIVEYLCDLTIIPFDHILISKCFCRVWSVHKHDKSTQAESACENKLGPCSVTMHSINVNRMILQCMHSMDGNRITL